MEFKLLSNNIALQAGADLWVIPPKADSEWSNKIDWYLNFQWMKTLDNKSFKFSNELKQIIKTEDLDIKELDSPEGKAIMFSSAHALPNNQLVVIKYKSNEQWLKELYKIWNDLNQPSLRVFLPKGLKKKEIQEFWQFSHPKEIQIVE